MEGGKKEEEESKGHSNDMGEVEEREGAVSLEEASDNDKIYGAIASRQGTNSTNAKDDTKENNDKEGRMGGVP